MIKILHLEDSAYDAELVRDLLERELPDAEVTLARVREEFERVLGRGTHDLVLSDFKLPQFSGWEALALVRKQQPDLPVIFVSGTVGEDTAAEIVRAGAADYLLKDRLQRLPLAIRRALRERDDRRQHREAENRIREQAALLDKARDGIVVTDLHHRVVFWNQGAERILGWAPSEALGQDLTKLLGAAFSSAARAMAQQLIADEEWRQELSLRGKLDRSLIGEVRVTSIRAADGTSQSYLTLITDITERKKLEEQFLRAQRIESLGMLAAGIAHDLNNALAPMLMAGELLRSRLREPADEHLLETLQKSAGRSAGLVKQIVSFAAGSSHERMLIQAKHLLRDIVRLIQDTFPKSIRLETEISSKLWTIRGNPTQIHQILLNLCINARDAMPDGGQLRLRGQNQILTADDVRRTPGAAPGNFLMLEVRDTGSGISAELLTQIWEPFFTTKTEGKGTGLGLSTVRGIAASHGGFVTVQSEVGHGSTFRVFLPAVETDVAPASLDPRTQPRTLGRGELVFVVEDQASIRQSMEVILEKHGYRTLTATDGMDALVRHSGRMGAASLIITDFDMPDLNGAALAQAARQLNPAVKVILMSGAGQGDNGLRQALKESAGFLPKPFSAESLLEKVWDALHERTPAL